MIVLSLWQPAAEKCDQLGKLLLVLNVMNEDGGASGPGASHS